MAAHLDDGRRGEHLREGLVFAVTGRPNVGKSSLVNALAERDVAIVSTVPGTTRDALETRIVLGGVPVTLVDTAGLRESADAIEAEGVRRARARAAESDLVLVVTEPGTEEETNLSSSPPPLSSSPPPVSSSPRTRGPRADAAPAALGPRLRGDDDNGGGNDDREAVHVMNKLDLGGVLPAGAIGVSALTGQGLDALRLRLAEAARSLTESAGPPPLTQARHRVALQEAQARLADARIAELPELRAEDLRLALRALGRITGSVGVEDILDTLFARFCIGK
jgi:tRNA modification GTPase